MPSLLTQFAYLQLLDLLTTLTFLASGVGEANPMVRFLVAGAGSAIGGLLAAKLIACSGWLFTAGAESGCGCSGE